MKRTFLLLVLLLVFTASLRAQHPSSSETKPLLRERIAVRLPRFSGYVQTGYQWSDEESTFFLKRIRLSMTGDIMPKVDYKIQIEFAKPQIVDAFIQYKPLQELKIKLGQYKVPFSIENTGYAPSDQELIETPLVLRYLLGSDELLNGATASGRDIGATLWGGFFKRDGYSIVNYDISVFNGAGINCRDDNKSKDVVTRLTLKPVNGLLISGSYYWGEYGASYLKRERYAAGACYDRGAVVVRGEWIGGTTGLSSGTNLDSSGWYVLAGWRAPHALMPAVRMESFTADNTRTAATRQTNYTAGLKWAPVEYFRCQLNYTYEDYGAAYDLSHRHVVAVMVTGKF